MRQLISLIMAAIATAFLVIKSPEAQAAPASSVAAVGLLSVFGFYHFFEMVYKIRQKYLPILLVALPLTAFSQTIEKIPLYPLYKLMGDFSTAMNPDSTRYDTIVCYRRPYEYGWEYVELSTKKVAAFTFQKQIYRNAIHFATPTYRRRPPIGSPPEGVAKT